MRTSARASASSTLTSPTWTAATGSRRRGGLRGGERSPSLPTPGARSPVRRSRELVPQYVGTGRDEARHQQEPAPRQEARLLLASPAPAAVPLRREGHLFGAAVVASTTGERRRRTTLRGSGETAAEDKEAATGTSTCASSWTGGATSRCFTPNSTADSTETTAAIDTTGPGAAVTMDRGKPFSSGAEAAVCLVVTQPQPRIEKQT